MNPRTWRAGALAASIAVVVLLVTQRAAGQPTRIDAVVAAAATPSGTTSEDAPYGAAIPESGSLVLLGAAFVVVAHQIRRLV